MEGADCLQLVLALLDGAHGDDVGAVETIFFLYGFDGFVGGAGVELPVTSLIHHVDFLGGDVVKLHHIAACAVRYRDYACGLAGREAEFAVVYRAVDLRIILRKPAENDIVDGHHHGDASAGDVDRQLARQAVEEVDMVGYQLARDTVAAPHRSEVASAPGVGCDQIDIAEVEQRPQPGLEFQTRGIESEKVVGVPLREHLDDKA